MFLYLFLTVLCGVLSLGALVVLIAGLVKRRKTLLVTGAIVFAASALGGLLSVTTYVRKAVDYVQISPARLQ